MEPRARSIALAVIRQASRAQPADALLRETLRQEHGLAPDLATSAAKTVFAFFRWRGWLEGAEDLEQANALDERFRRDPASFTDGELLARALPAWVGEEMPVSTEWARALQAKPALWLRARRGQADELARRLDHCRALPCAPEALEYLGRADLFRTPEFHAGQFEVQDIHSQAVGWLCAPKPGETWWDACAGEGGKTLHLSDLMENKGLIWASDRAEWRLRRLKLRTRRAGAFNYRAAGWDGGPGLPTQTKFDGVLMDAPCTGLGTWQRNPHARWTTTPQDVQELAVAQQRLLTHAVPAVKPGGKLVYVVCTLTRAETTAGAESFTQAHPDFTPLPLENPFSPTAEKHASLWLWPQATRGNGMFVAAWQRAG